MELTRKRAIQYLLITSLLWSTGGLFIKLVDWNPIAIASMRSGIAALVILVYMRRPRIRWEKTKLYGAISYTALVMLFVTANKMTTSANAILLQFTAPVWVALFARWFLKEAVRRSDWTTIAVVAFGMLLFFVDGIELGHMVGNLLALFSGVALASVVICLKLQRLGSPVEITLLGNSLAFLVGLPFVFLAMPSATGAMALVFMGVFQLGISYILYATAIRYVSAVDAILLTAIEPILNPVWVFWVTRELPSPYALFGGLTVVVAIISRGIYQANRTDKPTPRPRPLPTAPA